MSAITITPVTNPKELKTFITCQWNFYTDSPYWVPPLIADKMKLLSKTKNPFFQHAEAAYFLAWKDGKIVGRIAAVDNQLHQDIHKDNVGFFGMFESINDQEVASTLFNAAAEWLRKRGRSVMRGPANLSSNDDWGMLLEGYDDQPRFMMPYNPPYYITLCENHGMQKAKDLLAWKITYEKIERMERIKRVADIARKRSKVTCRALNMKNFDEDLNKFKQIYNKAWAPNWGFVAMTDEEINHMANDFKMIVNPEMVVFMENEKGEPIGAALPLKDFNFTLKKLNGRLLPFGWLKMLRAKKEVNEWVRIITLGIIPEYQRKGLDAVLYDEVRTRASKLGVRKAEASWVLEDNDMMNRGALEMDAEAYKKYRIYDYKI